MITNLDVKRKHETKLDVFIATFQTSCRNKEMDNDFESAMIVLSRLLKNETDRNKDSLEKREQNIPKHLTEPM